MINQPTGLRGRRRGNQGADQRTESSPIRKDKS